jgi:hypothetical protein
MELVSAKAGKVIKNENMKMRRQKKYIVAAMRKMLFRLAAEFSSLLTPPGIRNSFSTASLQPSIRLSFPEDLTRRAKRERQYYMGRKSPLFRKRCLYHHKSSGEVGFGIRMIVCSQVGLAAQQGDADDRPRFCHPEYSVACYQLENQLCKQSGM